MTRTISVYVVGKYAGGKISDKRAYGDNVIGLFHRHPHVIGAHCPAEGGQARRRHHSRITDRH
ncbi:MAG: hypothetical protein ABIJ53_06395 [Verrucomicrobiota bacterium]